MKRVRVRQVAAISMAILLTIQLSGFWSFPQAYAISEAQETVTEETEEPSEDASEALGGGGVWETLEPEESDGEASEETTDDESVSKTEENADSVSGGDAITDEEESPGDENFVQEEEAPDESEEILDEIDISTDDVTEEVTEEEVIDPDIENPEESDVIEDEEELSPISDAVPVGMEDWVAAIGPDGIEVTDGCIRLLEDRTMTGTVTVANSLVLDLNGFSLSYVTTNTAENMLYVTGQLTLQGGGTLMQSGGDNVISISAGGSVINEDCEITGSNCTRGVFCAGTFAMRGGSISGIHTQANGGGIVVHGSSGHLDMSGGEISGNSAWFGGGVRIQTGATADIYGDAVISGNSGASAAGGIHVLNSTCHIYGNAMIINNSSQEGGGIYVSGTGVVDIEGDASVLYNVPDAYATTDSGVVNVTGNAVIGGESKTLQDWIDETPVGGVLELNRDFLNESPVVVTKDITISFNGHTVSGASNNTGQMILCQGCNMVLQGPGELSQAAGPTTLYPLVNVQDNSFVTVDGLDMTSFGSRGFLVENAELHFISGSVTGCGGAISSGGVMNLIGGKVVIEDGQFYNNLSSNGAVVRALSGSEVIIHGGTFDNNQANYGGAVYVQGSILEISGGTFSNNRAMNGRGGAVWSDSQVVISGSARFSGNQSRTGDYTCGGAVYGTGRIVLRDNPVFDGNTAGFGGAIFSTDTGSVQISGGEFLNNSAAQLGGAVCGTDILIDGDTVSIHDNNACWGGGVIAGCVKNGTPSVSYIQEPGQLVISSAAQITKNKVISYGTSYYGWGGGIWAYDCELTGGALISENESMYGGGIYSRHSLRITDADITYNTADIGGGIFLYNEGFIQGNPDNRIHIMGNTATDNTRHGFAGGGIFVEHLVNSTYQGPYGANLQINGVIITDNTAYGGGGLGGCGEAMVHTYGGVGMAMYDNHSTGPDTNGRATDLYLDGYGTLSSQGIGHTNIVFEGLGKTDSSDWHEYVIDNGSETLHGMRFSASMSEADKALADQIAGVIITGNVCASNGGGIGGNGAITLGMPVQEITATKVWDDDGDSHEARPEILNLTLKHRGRMIVDGELVSVDEVIDTQPVTAEDGWKYTWQDLEELDDANQPWTYYVDEIEVPDYLKDISGTIITNHYAYTEFTIQKVWDDAEDVDGIRPESVTVTVLRDGAVWDTAVLSADNDWAKEYTHVEKYAPDRHVYVYSVKEESIPGYITSVSGFTVTNHHTPAEMMDFTVEKVWDDGNDVDGLRPGSVTIEVFQNGILYDTAVLDAACGWQKSYTDVPKTDPYGVPFVYTVGEVTVPEGYISVVNGYVITNTHIPEEEPEVPRTTFTVRKIWDDQLDVAGVRPEQITVQVLRDGELFDTLVLNESNSWSHTYAELPAESEDGKIYVYTVAEPEIPDGYVSQVDGYVITNTYQPPKHPETTEFLVRKIWQDAEDVDGLRPEFVEVNVWQNDHLLDTAVLSEANHWEQSYENLPKYDGGGQPYVYTIEEPVVSDGYESVINGFEVINVHIPEDVPEVKRTSFTVAKMWDDDGNVDGLRPETVAVSVFRNNVLYDTAVLDENNNWSKTYLDIEAEDENGQPYVYTLEERTFVSGYDTEVSGFTVVNRHVPEVLPETMNFVVQKLWDDMDDKDGIRPESVTIQVLRDGQLWDSLVLGEWNNWQHQYTDIEKHRPDGTVYTWEVREILVPDGYESIIAGFTVVNRHVPEDEPETVEFAVRKVWDDTDDVDGLRPDSVVIQVLRDGRAWTAVVLNDENGWSHIFYGLEAGHVYTIAEEQVPDGYTVSISGYTVTNRHVPDIPDEPEETPSPTPEPDPSPEPEPEPVPTPQPTVPPETDVPKEPEKVLVSPQTGGDDDESCHGLRFVIFLILSGLAGVLGVHYKKKEAKDCDKNP